MLQTGDLYCLSPAAAASPGSLTGLESGFEGTFHGAILSLARALRASMVGRHARIRSLPIRPPRQRLVSGRSRE